MLLFGDYSELWTSRDIPENTGKLLWKTVDKYVENVDFFNNSRMMYAV